MYDDLKDKRVLVTGGASGIGLATAKRFVKESCQVVILDCNRETLDQALAEQPAFAGGVYADVSNQDEVEAALREVHHIMGGIDVLISNAGISIRKPFIEVDYTQWSRIMRVNLDGMFFCARAAIERMEPQQSGVILFTASTSGLAA
ncbi:MAG: SDR family oxidoreductase, partial [Gammaproteobacteria bacterium]|nr:SDR family oxidoreductase [Gammaproteobacteria bacterium]